MWHRKMHLKSKRTVKKNFLTSCILIAVFLISKQSFAQYPIIPKAMEDSGNAAMESIGAISDAAFAKAWPTIQADEKKGKPFIPWAAKSSDLPQAKIPAFPGAEGGGAFTAGGRGGKVFVVKSLEDRGPGTF